MALGAELGHERRARTAVLIAPESSRLVLDDKSLRLECSGGQEVQQRAGMTAKAVQ